MEKKMGKNMVGSKILQQKMSEKQKKILKLKIGQKAPLFKLPDQNGKIFNSADYLGEKNLIVFFYPKDFTPGCTAETKSFCFNYSEFQKYNCQIAGISADSKISHQKFADKLQVNFPLLSDKDNFVRKLFRVKKSLFIIPGRETFLIDKKGIIRHHISNLFDGEIHVLSMLDFLKENKL